MEVGFIGLGRMGSNLVGRMLSHGNIRVVVWNRHPEPVREAVKKGAVASRDVKDLVGKLKEKKKIVWLMLPAGQITEDYFQKTIACLRKGDIIIDGANSFYKDTLRRQEQAKKKGINMLDVGVSGGLLGAERGFAMMVGGEKQTYEYCKPLFHSMCQKEGYALVGQGGAGHYVKMIHNAVEYGMMQAIAEGFHLLEHGKFKVDAGKVAHVWNNGCIISGFLMERTEDALKQGIKNIKPWVEETGEGRWSVLESIEQKVPFTVNTYALQARLRSQDPEGYDFKLLAGVRQQFGGHKVKR